jgi:uncharacterized membrane protein
LSNNQTMEVAGVKGAADFSLFTRRIHAQSVYAVRNFGLVVGALAGFSLAVAVVFSALGAWLILPFAGLEAIALVGVYDWVRRHAQDSESLVIRGDAVTLAVREAAQTRQYEFHRAWAKLVVDERSREVRLALRSHGRQVEVGRYLDGGGRQKLARELRMQLATQASSGAAVQVATDWGKNA